MAVACARDVLLRHEEVGQQEFAPDIGRIEVSVFTDAHGPDGVAFFVFGKARPLAIAECWSAPHGVIEAHLARFRVPPDADTPNTTAGGREVPAFGMLLEGTCGAVVNPSSARRIEGDRWQALCLTTRYVEKAGAGFASVIEKAEIRAVRGTDAVNHPRLEIGDEELVMVRIKGDVAERGAGVGPPFVTNLGEGARPISISSIEPVDGTRAASF